MRDAPLVVEPEATAEPEETAVLTPNVIFVQLESFFNVNELAAEYSQDPIPVFPNWRGPGPAATSRCLRWAAARPIPNLKCFRG